MTEGTRETGNACQGDKASASLSGEIEAVNLRGNNNFYSSLLSRQRKLREIHDRPVYLGVKKAF